MSAQNYTEIFKREPRVHFSDMKPGMILKFDPGAHTTKPYYAQVLIVYDPITTNGGALVLYIPGYKRVKIDHVSFCFYHCKRISIVGLPTPENLKLIHNQTIE